MINSKRKPDDTRLKRLRYRSWHRGCKETDLVLGRFADRNLAALPLKTIDIYEQFLEENDADIWAWLTGKEAPEEYGELLGMIGKEVAGC